MLNGKDGSTTYIIDEEYRIVYFEEGLKRYYPEIKKGDYCYKIFCNTNKPCSYCPVYEENEKHSVLFSGGLKEWQEITTTQISQENGKKYFILIIKEIENEKRSVFENLSAEEQEKYVEYEKSVSNKNDRLTGLYRRTEFFFFAKQFLHARENEKWCMLSIDIEHFKLFNEWYGQKTGDFLLQNIGTYLKHMQEMGQGVAGYFGGDDFFMIVPNKKEYIHQIYQTISHYLKSHESNAGFFPTFGVYQIQNLKISVSTMCNNAQIAATFAQGNYGERICWFDEKMTEEIEKRQSLLSGVKKGIENREFTFYVQPKCNMGNGKIAGMEALVRWIHPERGMISPGEYIPLLESCGLITELDQYIWEEVCKTLQDWQKSGCRMLPISINVSIADIKAIHVPEYLYGLTTKYQISPEFLEIEITETVFAENSDIVNQVIDDLRKMGFCVSMDDFGSGYSSLNMLKDVNVDILKIDMKFIQFNDSNCEKGISILESVIKLAHNMNLQIIAEGVEEKMQVDFLKSMGCIYAQGYYFYRPMPKEEMKKLLLDNTKIDGRIRIGNSQHFYAKDFLKDNHIGDTVLNSILGPSAYYETFRGELVLVRFNEEFSNLMGLNVSEWEGLHNNALDYVYEEDHAIVWKTLKEAYEKKLSGARGVIRHKKHDGSYIRRAFQVYFLREKKGHKLYYVSAKEELSQSILEKTKKEGNKIEEAFITLFDMYYKILKVNLTDDTFEIIKVEDDEKKYIQGVKKISEWFFTFVREGRVHEKDAVEFQSFTNLQYLRMRFEENKKNVGFHYRRKEGKFYRWVQMDLVRCEEYRADNQVVMLYIKDIHEEYSELLSYQKSLEDFCNYDTLTQLFNRNRFSRDEMAFSRIRFSSVSCIYFDANGLHEINNYLGHKMGDLMLCCIADAIRKNFPEQRAYRIGGDEFVVLCFDVEKKIIEEAVNRVQMEVREKEYEVSVGIEWAEQCDSIQSVVNHAENIMRKNKEEYYRKQGNHREVRSFNRKLERILTEKEDVEQFLQVLAPRFKGVYFVNFMTDVARYVYIPPYFEENLKEANYYYSKAMRLYVSQFVKKEYWQFFEILYDYSQLRKILEQKQLFEINYQKESGEWLTLQILNFNESLQRKNETLWIFYDGGVV